MVKIWGVGDAERPINAATETVATSENTEKQKATIMRTVAFCK